MFVENVGIEESYTQCKKFQVSCMNTWFGGIQNVFSLFFWVIKEIYKLLH